MQLTIVKTVSPHATRSHPWEPWVEPDVPCFWCGDGPHEGVCRHAPYYVEEAKVTYFGVAVTVIERFTLCALVRRPDGLSCVVDVVDLEVRG